MKAKKKLIVILCFFLAAAGLCCGWIHYINHIKVKYSDISVNSRKSIVYDATEEIKAAEANYKDDQFQNLTENWKAIRHHSTKFLWFLRG